MPKESADEKKKKAAFKHITRLYHKEDGFGWFRDEWWTICKANASTGRITTLTKGPHHDAEPQWSPDSKRIAFVSQRGKNAESTPDLTSLFVMDRHGKGLRELTPTSGSRSSARWSGDGRSVYWVGYEGKSGEWLNHEYSVWRTDVASGTHVALNKGHDRWPMNMVGADTSLAGGTVLEPYQVGGRERVLFGSDEDGSYRLYSVGADGGRPRLEVGGKLSILGAAVHGGEAVYMAATVNDLGEIYRVTLDGTNTPKKLTNLTGPFFTPLRLSTPEEVRVKSGPVELQGWVLKPPTFKAGKKYPVLIEVVGGPMTQYGESCSMRCTCCGAGLIVTYCNPRAAGAGPSSQLHEGQ